VPARLLRWGVTLGTAVMIAAIAAAASLLVARLETTAEANAAESVERAARAAEAAVNRQFLAVDGMLAGLPPLLGHRVEADAGDASRMLRDLAFQNFNFRNLLLVRPETGAVWAAALPDSRRRALPVPPVALREAMEGGTVAIIGPVRSATTGEWTLFFARRARLPGEDLLALAEVPVPQVAAVLAPIVDGSGLRITVERRDGTVLASLPHDESAIGRALARKLPPPERETGTIQLDNSRLAETPAIVLCKPTLYRDIVVTVGFDRSQLAAKLDADRQRLLFGAIAAAILLLALAAALNLALRQRERVDAERAAARTMLENAIEALPDGFCMFDAEDRLIVANSRYRQMYDRSVAFIHPGATFESIIRGGAENGQYPQRGDDLDAFVRDVCAWHRGNHPPLERLLPDGRWLLVTERSVPNGGTVGVRTDISALKRANAELAMARDAAATATRAKSLFLARMSHELRTPLNGVLGLAQALARDPALSAEARQRAETLEAAGRHMVAVANDLLDLARAEEGRIELHESDVALAAILDETVALIRPAAGDKAVGIITEFAANLPEHVRTDPTRLRQVALNLLSNAVKFTPSGGRVTLAACAIGPADPDATRIRLEVRDTGPGVPEAARQAIFGDFVQVAGEHARGGAGLGLAIVARIVERLGGEIGCDSAGAAGSGALFWVELPLRLAVAEPVPLPPQAASGTPRPLRLLVVDDVPANLAVARALLGSAGHETVCVDSGADALTTLAAARGAARYDAALIDVMMPGMDGLETTRRIRAMPDPDGRLPIMAVTASAFPEDIVACREAGMDAHLAKPIERAALLAALDRLLRTDAEAPPLLRPDAADALIGPGLDRNAAAQLRHAFVVEIELATDALKNAAAANPQAVSAAAHRLAGAAATLGAARLAAEARQLEREAKLGGTDREPLRRAVQETARLTLGLLRGSDRAAA